MRTNKNKRLPFLVLNQFSVDLYKYIFPFQATKVFILFIQAMFPSYFFTFIHYTLFFLSSDRGGTIGNILTQYPEHWHE